MEVVPPEKELDPIWYPDDGRAIKIIAEALVQASVDNWPGWRIAFMVTREQKAGTELLTRVERYQT